MRLSLSRAYMYAALIAALGATWLPATAAAHARSTAPSGTVERVWPLPAAAVPVRMLAGAGSANRGVGTWAATGSLTTPRYGHTATLLPTGKVLVAGGMDANGKGLASAELYDPASGTWTSTGSMLTGRYDQAATLLPSGQVLVSGGQSSWSQPLSSAELYDPASGTWRAAGTMSAARENHAAVLLPTGKVLVAGGDACASFCAPVTTAELFDPATGAWSNTGTMLSSSAPATALADGHVLAAGRCGGACTDAELYDPSAGTWTATGSMVTARSQHTATLLYDGRVLITGGCWTACGASDAEVYNPSTGTFTATGSMLTPRDEQTATLLPSGQVLVAGGSNPAGPTPETELYDPGSGLWLSAGAMPAAPSGATATLLPSGQVLVAGGCCDPSGSYLTSAEIYTPSTLTASPTSGTVLQPITVTGTSFSPGEQVSVYWDNPSAAPLVTTTAAADGSIVVRIPLPGGVAARHVIIAEGQTSRLAAFAYVGVKPLLLLAPHSGTPGSAVIGAGAGFGAREPVRIYWDKPTTLLGTAITDQHGSFYGATAITATVPLSATPGVHGIYAVGQASHTVGVGLFTVH